METAERKFDICDMFRNDAGGFTVSEVWSYIEESIKDAILDDDKEVIVDFIRTNYDELCYPDALMLREWQGVLVVNEKVIDLREAYPPEGKWLGPSATASFTAYQRREG